MITNSKLIELLEQTQILVDKSEGYVYAGLSPAEISLDLVTAIDSLKNDKLIDRDHLRMHFAPTGSLQETAMMSGWTDEYMRISKQFDDVINNT